MKRLIPFPLKFVFYPWLVVIFLYIVPVFSYNTLHLKTILFIVLFFVFLLLGYVIGISSIKFNLKNYDGYEVLNKSASFVILFCFVFILIKLFTLQTLTLSFSSITESRYDKIHEGIEKGGSLLGIIATFFSGFPILGLALLIYSRINEIKLSKIKNRFLILSSILGLLFSLQGGGRNSFLIYFLIVLIAFLIFRYKYRFKIKKAAMFKKDFKKIRYFSFFVLFVFISIIIARINYRDNNFNLDKKHYLEYAYGIPINSSIAQLVTSNNQIISNFSEAFVNIYYYASHGIVELDKTLHSDPNNYPYFGAYQFYTITLGLNKIGFEIITIEQILNEIVNPGKYFGFIGSSFLDFGYFSFVFFFLIGFSFGNLWIIFLKENNFVSTAFLLALIILLIMSPVYSYIGIGAFLPFIISIFFLKIYNSL